jgi:hypothetical protein
LGWFNALRRRTDVLNIGEVACPSRSEFRGDKIVLRNKERLEAGFRVNHGFNPSFPCRVKIDARDVGKNIKAARITSKTKETAARCEVFRANALERCAELSERGIRRLRVSGVCLYEKVDVMSFVKRGCA